MAKSSRVIESIRVTIVKRQDVETVVSTCKSMSGRIACNIKHKQVYFVERRTKAGNKLLSDNTTREDPSRLKNISNLSFPVFNFFTNILSVGKQVPGYY